jgi:hypothetical protein
LTVSSVSDLDSSHIDTTRQRLAGHEKYEEAVALCVSICHHRGWVAPVRVEVWKPRLQRVGLEEGCRTDFLSPMVGGPEADGQAPDKRKSPTAAGRLSPAPAVSTRSPARLEAGR